MKKERDFTIQHLLLEVYSDEQLNMNVIFPFPSNASRQTSNSTMRQKQTSRVHRAPVFFRSEKVQKLATIGLPSNYN